jgi:hypothetical protein
MIPAITRPDVVERERRTGHAAPAQHRTFGDLERGDTPGDRGETNSARSSTMSGIGWTSRPRPPIDQLSIDDVVSVADDGELELTPLASTTRTLIRVTSSRGSRARPHGGP